MEADVDLEPASARVALVAASERANKRLLTGVSIFVRLQMAFCDKVVVAYLAGKRPLASVSSHVGLQISRLGKLLQTALVGTQKYLGFVLRPRDLFNIFYAMKN
jgi:hypothetical protein